MPRPAVALAAAGEASAAAPSTKRTDLDEQLSTLGKQIGYGRKFRPKRSQFVLIALAVLGFWLVIVFGRALTELNEVTARQAVVVGETQALQLRLEAGRRELQLVQTDSFQALQARSFGMGEPGEIVFSLQGADTGLPIIPLGSATAAAPAGSPLDAWLDLLFGD
ncbi:MAG TPA: hypothetical protein VEX62_04000 [Candidatus Limnocylindrales bacterium]|nr:hypothetical protein [Candidatus Limnocylindrales bacterium]